MKDGASRYVSFESVFIATGRVLNIEGLELPNARIQVREDRIGSNDYLQTSNKHVFLCGDVAGRLKFSHVAEYHARILINNFFSPIKKKHRVDNLSWVTFTDPELATFGLSEAQLRQRGIPYERLEQDFVGDDRAAADDYRYGKLIVLIKKGRVPGRRRILGGSMIAPNAGELIQELLLLQISRSSLNPLFDKIYPYPVAARINQQLAIRLRERQITSVTKALLRWAFHL
jgi:pyruvate/2-oxoglutarate dehydrogenase complex dihydrolipoamide dehydrogenase (E3) component